MTNMTDHYMLDGEDTDLSIPRGGPIYVRDMVGPIIRISNFEASVMEELEKLKGEISVLSDVPDEDLCVEELNIIPEDELVSKAFEEAFKDVEQTGSSSKASERQTDTRRKDGNIISNTEPACSEGSGTTHVVSDPIEPMSGAIVITDGDGESSTKVLQKRKRRGRKVSHQNRETVPETYIEKVKHLASIKQKQDDDRAAVCLHSFKDGSRVDQNARAPSDGTEKMESLRSTSVAKVRQSDIHEYVSIIHPELVLCMEVYHNKRQTVKTQEFLVLGCQPLSDLKDTIHCSMDEIMDKADQYDPSGYFLIEEVFYNDLRDPSAINYSEPIFDWLRNSEDEARKKWRALSGDASKLPRFRAAEMDKIRFRDLQFRVGASYIYCHQGDCKHVIVIRDLRLFHPEDVQNRAAYPITTYQAKLRFQKCSVCKIYRAEKVTVDDKWAAENPCYFCNNCYYMLHYENGSLLYDHFSVFDYHHE